MIFNVRVSDRDGFSSGGFGSGRLAVVDRLWSISCGRSVVAPDQCPDFPSGGLSSSRIRFVLVAQAVYTHFGGLARFRAATGLCGSPSWNA